MATTAEILNQILNQVVEYIAVKTVAPDDGTYIGDINFGESLPAGTNSIGDLGDVATINSVAPQFDDTDKIAVSLYGKATAAGDTAIIMTSCGSLKTIGTRHWHLHQGNMFSALLENAVTNIGEMTVIAFNTPATSPPHLWISGSSTHAADLYLYENTSIDVDEGTDYEPINRKRVVTMSTSVLTSIKTTPVANQISTYLETAAAAANITTTTEIDHEPLIGGAGPKALGALGQDDFGYKLAASQQYAVMLVAGTNDDATHNIKIIWIEPG